jgi:alpha-1,2-mannosyltransferase
MSALGQNMRAKRSVVVTVGCLAALWAIGSFQQTYGSRVLAAERTAFLAWIAGDSLYTDPGTSLPPVAAILLVPTALVPLVAAGWLLALAGVAALLLTLTALAGPVARRYGRDRRPVVLAAGAVALLLEPVRATIGLGHLDLLVFGLIVADVVALRRAAWARSRATWWPQSAPGRTTGWSESAPGRAAWRADSALGRAARRAESAPGRVAWRAESASGRVAWSSRPALAGVLRRAWATGVWAGAGIGIASALAGTPLLFVAYLALTRQWRAALTAILTAATLVLAALLIAPQATLSWFGTVLPGIDRDGPLDASANQSLAGVLARLYDSASTPVLVWLSFAVLLLAVGLIRARSAHTDGDEITAFTLVGLTGAAVVPISTANDLLWVLPAILILIDAAARRRATSRRPRPRRFTGLGYAAAAAAVTLVFAAPAIGNTQAIVVIALLNTLPWRPAVPVKPKTTPAPRRVPAIPGPRGS